MSVSNVKEYWSNRYAKQGYLTTGFNGHNEKQMEQNYNERIEFIQHKINWKIDAELILDFGCGVGRYFPMLEGYGNYYGYDVNQWAIDLCNNKLSRLDKSELEFNNEFSNEEPESCTTLFTSTVLQHNTDEEVLRILTKYKSAEVFLLYEFTGKSNAPHMASRSVEDYERLSGKELKEFYSHITHGEQHSLIILG